MIPEHKFDLLCNAANASFNSFPEKQLSFNIFTLFDVVSHSNSDNFHHTLENYVYTFSQLNLLLHSVLQNLMFCLEDLGLERKFCIETSKLGDSM